jgi:glutaredoxin
MKRFLPYLFLALLPAVLLGALFPERLMQGVPTENGRYHSVPNAAIVAFVRDGCPHCAALETFAREKSWDVEYHEITDIGSVELFEILQQRAPGLRQGVPTIVIDGHVTQGYESDEKTGAMLSRQLDACRAHANGCLRFDDFLKSSRHVKVMSAAEGTCTDKCETDEGKYVFDLWILGKVNLLDLSLPALSLLLGFLDGFNPCAMWVLITLLTLLVSTRDMRKVWVIGGTFLFVSGVIYYLFIAAWLNVFLLVGINQWVQKVIGIVAIGGGAFYLFEAFGNDPNACRITDHARRARTIERMKTVLERTAWPAMIVGVAVLAVSVNMIELVCTAGLPVVFTQILAFNEVPMLARYAYLALYILMYMLDDLVIFAIAVLTLQATGLTTKYRRFTLIFGGLLMYALGLLLIFAPEALTFS